MRLAPVTLVSRLLRVVAAKGLLPCQTCKSSKKSFTQEASTLFIDDMSAQKMTQPGSPTKGPASSTQDPASPTQGPASPTHGPASPPQGPASPPQGPASPTQGPASPPQGPSPTKGPASPTQGPSPTKCTSPMKTPTTAADASQAAAGGNKMRAIIVRSLGEPDVMKLETVAVPAIAADQVLVKVDYAGINPVDTYIRAGAFGKAPPLPYTPGKDGAGVVHITGSAVTHVKAGDTVWFCTIPPWPYGTYAEFAVVKKSNVWPLPAAATTRAGAALGVPFLTAYRALIIKGNAHAGQSVLVHGASGAVGQACVQIAKKEGLTVAATAGSEAGKDILRELGVEHVFNHRSQGYVDHIRAKFPQGVDLIVEMLADRNLGEDCTLLTNNGHILVVGNRGSSQLNTRPLMMVEGSITGVALMAASSTEWEAGAQYVLKGVSEGWLKPRVAKEYALKDAAQAHIDIMDPKSGSTGKLLLRVKNNS